MNKSYKYNLLFNKILQRSGFTLTEMSRAAGTSFQNIKNHSNLMFIMSKERFLSNISSLILSLDKKKAEHLEMSKKMDGFKEEIKKIKEEVEQSS